MIKQSATTVIGCVDLTYEMYENVAFAIAFAIFSYYSRLIASACRSKYSASLATHKLYALTALLKLFHIMSVEQVVPLNLSKNILY